MKQVKTVRECRAEIEAARNRGSRIGFVPTMGCLHGGHYSLVERAAEECDFVVVSIFVNPTQFEEGEDFESYPRRLEEDLAGCCERNVSLVFVPGVGEIYPDWPDAGSTTVSAGPIASFLCGESRPGHFDGVCRVVSILFNIIQPDAAYFGDKDYQQLLVIRKMARDLMMPVEIVGCPTVRENDGLAMSSRNTYLDDSRRNQAAGLYRSLVRAEETVRSGESDPGVIEAVVREVLAEVTPEGVIDYVSVCDPCTLEPVGNVKIPVLVAIAVRIGKARLVDHVVIE